MRFLGPKSYRCHWMWQTLTWTLWLLLYHNNGWEHKLNETSTPIVNLFSKPWSPSFVHLPSFQKQWIAFMIVHTSRRRKTTITKKIYIYSLCIAIYADVLNKTPFYTHVNSYVVPYVGSHLEWEAPKSMQLILHESKSTTLWTQP